MKKFFILFIILYIHKGYCFGQQSGEPSTLPNIIPPSPTAFALGNYGNIPIGLFTGAPNTVIPLLSYKTNNLTLPLNLNYSSNGIKVDEVSTNVGLGWNLNFGGIITRMVRDKPDESKPNSYVPDNVTGSEQNSIAMQFFQDASTGNMDTEMDIYSFNFNGMSGRFFYDRNHQPHLVDQKQSLKIERIGDANGDGQDFLLTSTTGEKYYFTDKERTTYRTIGDGHSLPKSAITSWYLSKIEHPLGDEIYFTYETFSMDYVGSQSQTMVMSYPRVQKICVTSPEYIMDPSLSQIVDQTITINGKRIKTINSNIATNGIISFAYSPDTLNQDIDGNYKIQNITMKNQNSNVVESINFNYNNTPNKRNFLSNIFFKDPNKSYSFEYENATDFPARLSYKQDHWGYYNGAYNNVLVPKNIPDYGLADINYNGADKEPNPSYAKIGMLKKVFYPTKGYTELEYEGNTYWGKKTIMPNLFTKKIEIKTDNLTNDGFTEYSFISVMDQSIKINATLFGNGVPGCSGIISSGHIAGSLEVNGVYYDLTRDSSSHEITISVTSGQTVNVKVHSYFYCSRVRADISYYQTAPQTFFTNLDTGGVRVKSTKDYETISGQPTYKRFYYAHKDDINHSSGKIGRKPYYIDFLSLPSSCSSPCNLGEANKQNLVLASSSLINLFDTGTSNCLYEYVVTSQGGENFEKGGEMKTFKIHRDYFGLNLVGKEIVGSPWTNFGWDNGLELKSTLFAKDTNSQNINIIQEKEYIHDVKSDYNIELKNYNLRKRYEMACGNPVSKVCTAENITQTYTYTICIANHTHVWHAGNPKCFGNGAQNITHTIPDACFNKPIGYTVTYPIYLSGLDVMEYKHISYWHYLKSQKTTDYLNGVPVKTETEYFYNNPSHYQLNKQKNTLSDGTINETNFSYAHEKNNQYLINKNMIGIPLETETRKNGKIISKTETLYPANQTDADGKTAGLPLSYSLLSQDILTGSMAGEISYDKYDDKGNLLQYTTKEGIPVSIIWGYNQTKPIAKIEGVAYSWLLQNYSDDTMNIINTSNTDANKEINNDETSFLSALQIFRERLSIDRFRPLISTYTYDPLVGVRSITPPSGIRERYIYDLAGRLEKVIDMDGKILKELKYNYKN